ncbi:MAG: hypothetical protein ACYDBV_14675 [Nitrospiria bacterium]
MSLKLTPILNAIVLRLDRPKETKIGSIVMANRLPGEAEVAFQHVDTGTVVAVGPKAYAEMIEEFGEAPIKVGDRVIFDRYSGRERMDRDDPEVVYRVLPDSKVWALIEE